MWNEVAGPMVSATFYLPGQIESRRRYCYHGHMNPTNKKNLPILLFSFALVIVTIAGVWYVSSIGGPSAILRRSPLNQFGKFLGGISVLSLVALYGRTVFKLLLMKGDLWSRLEPLGVDIAEAKSLSGTFLSRLNTTHPYLGVIALSSVFLHCVFTNSLQDNIFLYAILALVFTEGVTGMIMELRTIPVGVKKENYLLHSQFFVGVLLLFLTLAGHLLLKF